MKGAVKIFGENIEYDFISAWIKYTRLQKEYTQEYLAHGICSTSHLSYFENGRKTLRPEIIEALLDKLGIHKIEKIANIGLIRQKFYNMMQQIETLNYDGAKVIYDELENMEALLCDSQYSIEYKLYKLMYKTFVEGEIYENLILDVLNLDKVYTSLSQELRYVYLFVSGRIIFKYRDHNEGIERLLSAANIRETAWVNYFLGFSYCFNSQPLKGAYYLEKALERYEKNGQYINATWCNNYLGICYVYLKIYEKSEKHFKAALTGAEYFNIDKIFWNIYTNLSDLYFCMKNYADSKKWSKLAMSLPNDSVLPACNYISAALNLHEIDEVKNTFAIYLNPEYKTSKYYMLLYFQYLKIFHIDDDIFYEAVTKEILPFYKDINYMTICREIKLGLIEYFEKKRKYKEACCIYRELLDYDL